MRSYGFPLLLLSVLACEAPPAAPDLTPGVSEGTSGTLEIIVVDLDSRAPITDAVVRVTPFLASALEEVTDDTGSAFFERMGMSAYALEVVATGYIPVRWSGVVGGRVVLPLRHETERETFSVTVAGLAADEHAAVSVTTRPALFQPSSVRLFGATGAAVASCEAAGAGGCTAELVADVAPSGRLVLIAVTDDAGAARRLVRFDGVVTGAALDLGAGEDLSLESLGGSIPVMPAGLDEVVGVPGISFGSAVGVLGFSSDGTSVTLPVVTGMLATRWALFVASAAGDPSHRSVLVDRRVEGELGPWTAWLTPPNLNPVAGAPAFFTASPGAALHVIDWLSSTDRVIRTDLYFDEPTVLAPPEGARRARVRAIDTTANAGDLRLDEAERATVRFAEHDVDLL